MSEIDPKHRQQIERWLGRPLTVDELRPAESLEALADDQLDVVAAIRPKNLVAPVLYLNFLVPSAPMDVLTPFIDNIASVVAARKYPTSNRAQPSGDDSSSGARSTQSHDWPNLPLFERYAGRALSPIEKQPANSLEELSPAHLAITSMLARQERTVAFLYLRRIVPSAAAGACDDLVKRLATSSSA
jgi:hypothetical protein